MLLTRAHDISEEDPARLEERAAFLKEVAASLAAGLTPNTAIATSAAAIPDRALAARARAAARLHAPPAEVLRALAPFLGGDVEIVALVAELHSRLGGDLGALVGAVARHLEARADDMRSARAHAAGAVASARTIALLPLGGLVVARALGAGPTGPDLLLALAGGALGLIGFRWLKRLLPRPSPHPAVEMIPAMLGAALAAGLPLGAALDAIAGAVADPHLDRARRAAHLGLSWPDALVRSGIGALADLGSALERGAALGLPLATSLERHAAARDLAARRRYEEELRRAPVRMILPLTLCVLPGFVLVTLGPLLRAIVSPA